MMSIDKKLFLILTLVVFLTGCANGSDLAATPTNAAALADEPATPGGTELAVFEFDLAAAPPQPDIPSVHKTYSSSFLVGAALEPDQLDSDAHVGLLVHHFNSLTAENAMKPVSIQPTEGNFTWENADKLVQFARASGMAVHGHTLVWHNQAAEWMFQDSEGNPLEATPENKELVLKRLEDHIRAVVGRYKEDINVWDVVNEVIDEQENDCMRRTVWYELTGTDYIVTAFQTADETAPEATLILNDYSTTDQKKRACIYKVVKELQAQGVPIEGIGMQMHANIQNPAPAAVEQTIEMLFELGEIHITELDLSVYPNDSDTYEAVPEDILLKQGYRYKELFEVFERQSDKIESVTFWGMADDHTWLKTFPITRLNLPLLFDENLQAKNAYWGIIDPLQLPIMTQLVDIPRGTPQIDGEAEILWATQPWSSLKLSDSVTAGFQTRWDENNLYVCVKADASPEDLGAIDVYLDENNGKTDHYEEDDRHITFQGGDCSNCEGVVFAIDSGEDGMLLEAAIPLGTEADIQDEIGFDIRVAAAGQNPAAWNDRSLSQDADTSKYGTLKFIDAPKVTAAVYGTPVIDGEEDEVWASANQEETAVWVLGASGSTGTVKTLWDEEYLYAYVVVTDSLLSKKARNPWEQDSFEIYVDQNNAKTTTYEPDDGQYRINFENERSYLGGAAEEKITTATRVTDSGYIVELAIQFDYIKPQEGMLIGYEFQVNNDENGDGIRDSVVTWNDPTHQTYQNTSRMGLLVFTK
ncbi:MAG: endo-1,4-beta-xylanase [Anaerolineales bacterium]|nr:endo-1,4-beta-xylanase [Anaerolineales bacterium]